MTYSELLMWLIAIGFNFLMFCLILGIYSLNYHKIIYKVAPLKFKEFFYDLKFPINIYYKWKSLYSWIEIVNRSQNLRLVQFMRNTMMIICAALISVNFLVIIRSDFVISIILSAFSILQFVFLMRSIQFGNKLSETSNK